MMAADRSSSSQPKPTLQIVVASTRPGRIGLPIAEWFRERVEADGRFEIDFADLKTIDLPFMDEPQHPRLQEYTHAHTKEWSARVAAADAFVFVHPEYNHGLPAPLKNALDYLHHEWNYKPVGFVSYGGVAAGTRATQMIKQVVVTLKLTPVVEAVSIPFVEQFFGDDGRLEANAIMEGAAEAMLTEIARLESALRPLRASV